ncbi:MAG: hypothetical protein M0015_16655 [Betaproteobacteria bacterium]|nr:hypothetical protein [Betaproteobacteria bacterium]
MSTKRVNTTAKRRRSRAVEDAYAGARIMDAEREARRRAAAEERDRPDQDQATRSIRKALGEALDSAREHSERETRRARMAFLREHKTLITEGARRSGQRSGDKKREWAAQWQKKIEAKVRRYIVAGKTNENIGRLLAADIGRSTSVIARFAAKVRRSLTDREK